MPYLQLDVNFTYTIEHKKALAKKMAETYADLLKVDIGRVTVAIREVGLGGIWKVVDGEPAAVSVLICAVQSGVSPEVHMEVAKALCADCVEAFDLREDRLHVEFTHHAGDDMHDVPLSRNTNSADDQIYAIFSR